MPPTKLNKLVASVRRTVQAHRLHDHILEHMIDIGCGIP